MDVWDAPSIPAKGRPSCPLPFYTKQWGDETHAATAGRPPRPPLPSRLPEEAGAPASAPRGGAPSPRGARQTLSARAPPQFLLSTSVPKSQVLGARCDATAPHILCTRVVHTYAHLCCVYSTHVMARARPPPPDSSLSFDWLTAGGAIQRSQRCGETATRRAGGWRKREVRRPATSVSAPTRDDRAPPHPAHHPFYSLTVFFSFGVPGPPPPAWRVEKL